MVAPTFSQKKSLQRLQIFECHVLKKIMQTLSKLRFLLETHHVWRITYDGWTWKILMTYGHQSIVRVT